MFIRRSIFALTLLSIGLLLGGASCIRFSTSVGQGGLFVSQDRATTWEQKGFVRQEKRRTVTINAASVYDSAQSPVAPDTLYLALGEDGLYRSTNGGDQWEGLISSRAGAVRRVAAHPKTAETIFAVVDQRIIRTTDGGKDWTIVYIENRPGVSVLDLQIDAFEPKRVYALFSNGSIHRSTDGGTSWSQFYSAERGERIVEMLFHPKDTRVLTLVTQNIGLLRTEDLGKTWTPILQQIESFKGARTGYAIETDPKQPQSLFYMSRFGLLKSGDGGKTWSEIKLLTDPAKTSVTTFTVDPRNPQALYYTTPTTLYLSIDGGKTWSTKALPTPYVPSVFAVHQTKSSILYLGGIKQ